MHLKAKIYTFGEMGDGIGGRKTRNEGDIDECSVKKWKRNRQLGLSDKTIAIGTGERYFINCNKKTVW